MKKKLWLALIPLTVLAVALRIAQILTGFDSDALAVPGNVPGCLLPVLLLAAAALFAVLCRHLPAQRDVTGGLGDCFSAMDGFGAALGIAGAFLTAAGAAFQYLSMGNSVLSLILSAFALLSAAAVLYAVFALFRAQEVVGLALLAPVCYLVLRLILLYRADAAEPVLAITYPELLAFSALTLSALERAAFAFRNGAPRIYIPVSAMAILLSFVAAVSTPYDLSKAFLLLGSALVELCFLTAARFDEERAPQ